MVQVEERQVLTVRQQSESIGGQLITVAQSGDTLYGIAFEHDLDVNQLAAWNNIVDTSRLIVGQRVRLTKPVGFISRPFTAPTPVIVRESKQPQLSNVEVSRPKKTKPAKSKRKPVNEPKPMQVNVEKPSKKDDNARVIAWAWPIKGEVIRGFSPSSTQQGIDISGKFGQEVRASAPGEVVYIGDSLKGYGNLIIIKHNKSFLSAYAHNRKIVVKEGQRIDSNQLIGTVGTNNRRETALHFQIRLDGKPVNPLRYLSAR
jgi:lipoprotein NlpD